MMRLIERSGAGICAVFLVAMAHAGHAGINIWTSHGPEGGNVDALALDSRTPRTLYAGTRGGVFKSTDAGAIWTATGLTNISVSALAVASFTPNTLYAGTRDGEILKSTDGAVNWRAVDTGISRTVVTAIAIDPRAPTTIYAARDGVDSHHQAAACSRARMRVRPGQPRV